MLVEVKNVMAISSILIMVVMSDEAEDVAMGMELVEAAIVMVLISIL